MEILKSGPMPLLKEITREKIQEKFGLTQRELYLLVGSNDARLFMLNSFDAISPDERCRNLTGGLLVPEKWLADHSGLTAEEIRAFDRGGEMEEEAKCRLFAVKTTAVRYFTFTVFPVLRKEYHLQNWELSSFLQEHPEALEGATLPEETISPEKMLAEDMEYFCEKTALPVSVVTKLAKGEDPYRLLVTAATLRNLWESEKQAKS